MPYDIENETFVARDGATLGWQHAGAPAGLPVIIANGPGADLHAWRGLIDEFGDRLRLITWDYRGLFRSAPFPLGEAASVRRLTDDAEDLLDHLGIERAVFLSWSLGTQVHLELHRRRPDTFAAFVAVNGACGTPFRFAPSARPASPLRVVGEVLRRQGHRLQRGVSLLREQPGLLGVARALRLVSPALQRDAFLELAGAFADLDHAAYSSLLRGFAVHDAADQLDELRCPTLFVAGRRDPIVPAAFSEHMAERVEQSELLEIPIASHYIPIEFAEYLNLKLEAFFDAHLAARRTSTHRTIA